MKKLIALLSFFVATTASFGFAEEESIFDFSGGLFTAAPAYRIPNSYSPYMRNVFVDDDMAKGVNGYTLLGSTFSLLRITGIFPYRKPGESIKFLVTDSSITLQTEDFNTWIMVSSGANTNVLMKWMQVRDKMWGYNGSDSVVTWDGSIKRVLNGTQSMPNVPKFKYGEYWHERVWGFNSSVDSSDLYFSDVASTDGARIEPDDSRAWPSTNNLKIGQGDGQEGTALWIQDGQLRVGKERKVFTIFGTNVSNYFAREEENIGDGVVSDESVVKMDNGIIWLGNDGIYMNGQRISDNIDNTVEGINREILRVVFNVWDTKNEFLQGYFYGSTVTAAGVVTVDVSTFNMNHISNVRPSGNYLTFTSTGIQATDFGFRVSTEAIPENFYGYVHSVSMWVLSIGQDTNVIMSIRNSRTRDLMLLRKVTGNGPTDFFKQTWARGDGENFGDKWPNPVFFTASDLASGKLEIQISTQADMGVNTMFHFYEATTTAFATIYMIQSSTSQYVSNIGSISILNSWGNFDATYSNNGGDVNWYLRTSTSLVNIATKTWASITPGAIIDEPTINKFVQWAATLTTRSGYPSIDRVSIGHIEGGGNSDRAFAISWKNRYWLATTTSSGSDFTYLLVKSKMTNKNPHAWMPIEGVNIGCFASNGGILYAGAKSTGSVYRLDYGDNFNGSAIDYQYQTPDLILGDNYRTKNIMGYKVDAEADSGLSLTLGTSIDGGAFSNSTVDLDGSGRKLKSVYGVKNPARYLRLSLGHNMIGKDFKLYDITVNYTPTDVPPR